MTTDILSSCMDKLGRMHISTWEENTSRETLPQMTTEGREKVEAAVYKEYMTTHDERILTCDESGQDTSNTSCLDEGKVKKKEGKRGRNINKIK